VQIAWQMELHASTPSIVLLVHTGTANTHACKTRAQWNWCRAASVHPAAVVGTHCVAEPMPLLVAAAAQPCQAPAVLHCRLPLSLAHCSPPRTQTATLSRRQSCWGAGADRGGLAQADGSTGQDRT
jgi:hypothetical protein